MFVSETFKQFCKERHEEDKLLHRNKNYNYMQEVYANTELFDLTHLTNKELSVHQDKDKIAVGLSVNEKVCSATVEGFKDISLPFQNMFIQIDGYSMFVREYEPYIITGSFYMTGELFTNPNQPVSNLPFTLNVERGELVVDTGHLNYVTYNIFKSNTKGVRGLKGKVKEIVNSGMRSTLGMLTTTLYVAVSVINNLPKYSVITDTKEKTEYYTRKQASTIKVTNRPIYYVLDKSIRELSQARTVRAVGTLAFSHSFNVRGHWRKLQNPNTIGKDRNGEYKVTSGYTWVSDFKKGEGELVKKVRIIQ